MEVWFRISKIIDLLQKKKFGNIKRNLHIHVVDADDFEMFKWYHNNKKTIYK